MSHEISMNRDGKAAAIYARKPAWHRLGEVTVTEFTAKEAMKKVGLDYGVDSATAGAMVMVNGQQVFVPYPSMKMNYKVDDDGSVTPVGIVGVDRSHVNPSELFEFMDEVVDDVDGAHYAAMFALRDFRQVVGCVDMGVITLDAKGRQDVIDNFLIGRASYDSSWQFGMKFDYMRRDCANQMAIHMAMSGKPEFTTRHTTNLRQRMTEAQEALGLYVQHREEYADGAEKLIETEITIDQAVKFIDGLFVNYGKTVAKSGTWSPEDRDDDAITQARVNYEFSPINDNVRGTVWGALNAATEYADWFVPTRGGKKTNADEALVLRQLGDTKAKYGNDFKQFAWQFAQEWAEESKSVKVGV